MVVASDSYTFLVRLKCPYFARHAAAMDLGQGLHRVSRGGDTSQIVWNSGPAQWLHSQNALAHLPFTASTIGAPVELKDALPEPHATGGRRVALDIAVTGPARRP